MSSELVTGVPIDVVIVREASLTLRPFLRRSLHLTREDVAVVEVERQWAPPLWWKTVHTFVLASGEPARKVFIAVRPRRFAAALTAHGWPSERVQFGSRNDPGRARKTFQGRGGGS